MKTKTIMIRAAALAAALIGGMVLTGCGSQRVWHFHYTKSSTEQARHTNLEEAVPEYTYSELGTGHLIGSDGFDLSDAANYDHHSDWSDLPTPLLFHKGNVKISGDTAICSNGVSANGSDTTVSDYSDGSGDGELIYDLTPKTMTLKRSNEQKQHANTLKFAKYHLHMIRSSKGFRQKEFVFWPYEFERNDHTGKHHLSKREQAKYPLRLTRNKCVVKGRYHHYSGELPSK